MSLFTTSGNERSEDLLKEVKTFFTEGNKKSDAVIQVEDHELHVDLIVISLMSPTLANEFQSRPDPQSPPSETNKAVAKLDGCVDHIVDMLTAIYPNFRSVVDKDNVENLLPLAAKYKLLFLLETCETFIEKELPDMNMNMELTSYRRKQITSESYQKENKDRLMRYFVLAQKNELFELRKRCMNKLVKCYYSTKKHEGDGGTPTRCTPAFQQLDPTTRWEILRNRLFYLEGTYGEVTDNLEDM
ncbi:uncharacterized protein [Haliotis cracherodii]|uniref:uncharacterized protein n=1 Tax=Haliotis cracherodii TaxID=6455 RepID=UPI0039ED3980